MVDIDKLLSDAPENFVIRDALDRCAAIIDAHQNIMCSVSGGADSDVMLDMIIRCGGKEKTSFIFFDTGLEYRATREHLSFLEKKYGIKIERIRPQKGVVTACKQHGLPFKDKDVAAKIAILQNNGFKFEDKPLDILQEEYPKISHALKWWCNANPGIMYNISRVESLKEFLIQNPPQFKISDLCCRYVKKMPSHKIERERKFDLVCIGIRKSEGGRRSTSYKNCFSENEEKANTYRPIFWFKDADKDTYCKHYGITHSDCYTVYGLKRTGCIGCPFAGKHKEQLDMVEPYEPNLVKAANTVFKDSYEYYQAYLDFKYAARGGCC